MGVSRRDFSQLLLHDLIHNVFHLGSEHIDRFRKHNRDPRGQFHVAVRTIQLVNALQENWSKVKV